MSLFYSILLCLILGSKKAVGQYDLWDPLKTEDECILHEYSKDRPECMLGYQRIGDKYYFPDIKGMGYSTWHEAWQMCRFMGGYLASFANIDELNEVANTVYWMGYDVMDSFWVDGNDLAEEGVYMNYESGKKVRSSLFTPGEPNNQGVERCLALWTASGQHYYGLNNFDCNKKQYYICQSKVINVSHRSFRSHLQYDVACLILWTYEVFGQNPSNDCSETQNCWPGYERIGEKLYWIPTPDTEKLPWHNAWLACRDRNGSLASFGTLDGIREVATVFYSRGFDKYDKIWNDGNDLVGNWPASGCESIYAARTQQSGQGKMLTHME